MGPNSFVDCPIAFEVPQVGMNGSTGETAPDVMAAVDYLEIQQLMRWDFSLFHMLYAMENTPVSFSLATASKQRLGFPLIYVNNYFETLTGYKRPDVIGKSAKFLQIDLSGIRHGAESSHRLALDLAEGHLCMEKMVNFRCNGEHYLSLVVLKPLFDSCGNLIYVASLQFDVSIVKDLHRAVQLSDFFVRTIPEYI